MDHAGEGRYNMYFEQDQTGIGALISQLTGHSSNMFVNGCAQITKLFKRYEQDTSSPSSSSSIVFGVYHSPVSGGLVTSTVSKLPPDAFRLKLVESDEWGVSLAVIQWQRDPSNPLVVLSAIFTELIGAIEDEDHPLARGQNDPITIHLETDIFTYRAMIMFAEKSGLRFRFFPTPAHFQFDKHRGECERQGREDRKWKKESKYNNKPGQIIEGGMDELLIERAPAGMRYHIIAYCAACAKQLSPDKRLQCSQCKLAFYCGAECQKKDWHNLHKKECKKFSKLVTEADCEYCKRE